MKLVLLILSGLAMSLVAFAGGVLTTITFLTAEPQQDRSLSVDTSAVWTTVPAKVDVSTRAVERVPARPALAGAGQTETASDRGRPNGESSVDDTITGAIMAEDPAERRTETDPAISAAHATWCTRRFRSYRPDDNSYRPYGGGRRPCISPYIEAVDALAPKTGQTDTYAEEPVGLPGPIELSADEPSENYLTPEHMDSCFARYRSYRPQDNTYQPYSGGPRRQCE